MPTYTYTTLDDQLTRAANIFTEAELQQKHLKPSTKVLVNGSTNLKTKHKWTDKDSLLTSNSLVNIINIEHTAVMIRLDTCNPPLLLIDIDSKEKSDIIMPIVNALPPHQQPIHITESIGGGKVGWHLLYHNTPEAQRLIHYVQRLHKGGNGDDIDILTQGKGMFIGNKGNHTKRLHTSTNPHKDTDDDTSTTILTPPPLVLQLACMALFKDAPSPRVFEHTERGNYIPEDIPQPSTLGYMFKDVDDYTPQLLGMLLAKRLKEDIKQDFIAPADESYPYQPKYYSASPHHLLQRVSGTLKEDVGISKEQHASIIHHINEQLQHPKNHAQLISEIIKPDQKDTKFKYIKEWEDMAASMKTLNNHIVNIYCLSGSTSKDQYLVHNTDTDSIRMFAQATRMNTELIAESKRLTLKKLKDIVAKASLVDLIDRPDHTFGIQAKNAEGIAKFNIYRRNEYQKVFYNKLLPRTLTYQRPTTILRAIESQMGQEKTHRLFLPFLKRKLLTRKPTALIFALMGPPHSFKTGLVEGIIKPLFSAKRFMKTNGEILTEKYNDFLINLDILMIDEIHHLKGTPLLKPVIQTLNKFGSEYHESIRAMYTSASNEQEHMQEVTPFITMNQAIKPTSEVVGERRLIVGYSTKKLSHALGMQDEDIKESIKRELIHFAYYLATEVDMISTKDYGHNEAWKGIDDHYYKFMADSIPKIQKLALYIGATYEEPKLRDLIVMYPDLYKSVVKLRAMSKGSQYRLRLWNARDSSYTSDIRIPGLVDADLEIEYNQLPSLLNMNEKVLTPTLISQTIKCRKQDLVISYEQLVEHNLLTDDGEPLLAQGVDMDIEPIHSSELGEEY